jgi:hypothetical protein
MTWILYIIVGTVMPNLQQVTKYADETVCEQAVKKLMDKNVKAVCLPKEAVK